MHVCRISVNVHLKKINHKLTGADIRYIAYSDSLSLPVKLQYNKLSRTNNNLQAKKALGHDNIMNCLNN